MPETIADDLDLDLAYQAIARDPRYAHFINIPERIIRCLDYFHLAANRIEVRQSLGAYYLFIGVVDDAIDSGKLEIGRDVLDRFQHRVPCSDDRTRASRISLVTEVLKRNISDDVYPEVVSKLRELYLAVAAERKAEKITAYIEQRKAVGRLTAELSYVLIRSLLEGLNVSMKHPALLGVFLEAVSDNVRDRFRAPRSATRFVTAPGKEGVP